MVREIKKEVEWKCQICGKNIILPSGNFYAEGHHLKPLGGEYMGPDTKDNIIILCPFHHAEFDYGAIAISPETEKIIHIDSANKYNGNKLSYYRKNLSNEFVKFHFEKIFNKK